MMRRVHPLTYPVARKSPGILPKWFARRDGGAMVELFHPLHEQGFAQGEPIFQQPPRSSDAARALRSTPRGRSLVRAAGRAGLDWKIEILVPHEVRSGLVLS